MTDAPRELPPNWQAIDSAASYDIYIRETGASVRAGEPLPPMFRPRDERTGGDDK